MVFLLCLFCFSIHEVDLRMPSCASPGGHTFLDLFFCRRRGYHPASDPRRFIARLKQGRLHRLRPGYKGHVVGTVICNMNPIVLGILKKAFPKLKEVKVNRSVSGFLAKFESEEDANAAIKAGRTKVRGKIHLKFIKIKSPKLAGWHAMGSGRGSRFRRAVRRLLSQQLLKFGVKHVSRVSRAGFRIILKWYRSKGNISRKGIHGRTPLKIFGAPICTQTSRARTLISKLRDRKRREKYQAHVLAAKKIREHERARSNAKKFKEGRAGKKGKGKGKGTEPKPEDKEPKPQGQAEEPKAEGKAKEPKKESKAKGPKSEAAAGKAAGAKPEAKAAKAKKAAAKEAPAK